MTRHARTDSRRYAKDDLGFYTEPVWATEALLTLPCVNWVHSAWDPCAGSGNIVRALIKSGRLCRATDIAAGERPYPPDLPPCEKLDFFQYEWPWPYAIISNPPYGESLEAMRFIEHARSLKPQLLAVFVDARFLFSGARHAFFDSAKTRPDIVAYLSDRPSCPPGDSLAKGDVKASGGTQNYVWLIWTTPFRAVPTHYATQSVWLRRPDKVAAP